MKALTLQKRTGNLIKPDYPCKDIDHRRRALISGEAKRPIMSLEKLQRSTVQQGESVDRATISRLLYSTNLTNMKGYKKNK